MDLNKRLFFKTWIAALRSGEYKQGQAKLASFSGTIGDRPLHCCLGVALCLLGVDAEKQLEEPDDGCQGATYKNDLGAMPSLARLAEMGLSRDEASGLAEMNDIPFTFKDIAARIERGLEGDKLSC